MSPPSGGLGRAEALLSTAAPAESEDGYIDDPTRAVYNHVWLIGDDAAISVPFQAEVDGLTELTKVSDGTALPADASADTGSSDGDLGPAPGTPESDPGGRLLPK